MEEYWLHEWSTWLFEHHDLRVCVANFLLFLTISKKMERAHYSPPWADTSIIGIAGSSGSGKTSLAVEIVSSLNLPWVVILSMVRFME